MKEVLLTIFTSFIQNEQLFSSGRERVERVRGIHLEAHTTYHLVNWLILMIQLDKDLLHYVFVNLGWGQRVLVNF